MIHNKALRGRKDGEQKIPFVASVAFVVETYLFLLREIFASFGASL